MTIPPRPLRTTAVWLTSLLVGAAVVRAAADPAPSRRSVEIEWDAIEGASAYEIRVTRKDRGGAPLLFKLKAPRWSATVKPGPYVMELRTFDRRGVPGAWSPPSDITVRLPGVTPLSPTANQTLIAKDARTEAVTFTWDALPNAHEYRVDITEPDGPFTKTQTTKTARLRVDLPVAADYAWHVTAIDDQGHDGETGAPATPFALRGPALDTPRPDAPLSKYVDRLTWPAVGYAEEYATQLQRFDRRTKTWSPFAGPELVRTGEYPLDLSHPSGRYRLSVVARAARRASSKRATFTFTLRGGFHDVEERRDAQLRDALDKPSAYYGLAALLPTRTTYDSSVYDTNSKIAFAADGQVLRVGLGYQSPRTRWGGLVTADLGRMVIAGSSFASQTAEAGVTYRLPTGRRGLFTIGGGLTYRQLPIVIGGPLDGFKSLGRATQIGPMLSATYARPWSERFSFGIDARIFAAAAGSTGAGQLDPTLAYGAQIFGAYRWTPRWTILGGAGFRHDEASWAATPGAQSYARPGDRNRLRMDGNSLNLGVEFGF